MASSQAEADDLVGTTVVGKYRVDALLGRGGMGAVYRATHVAIGKRVALKFLDRESAQDADSVTRFQREAEAASAVESAHIVQIFDSGAIDKRPFLVMELLQGEDLRARLRREGRIALAEALHMSGQVLRALSRAHAAGIVHRDLKPDNVFLCQRDDDPMFVKIVDFGISKVARRTSTADTLTRKGTVLGTAFYMSPEQAQAFRDIDGRTDLYSLGTILYEALSGRPPHVGSVYEAILIDICTKDAEDIRKHAPDVPEAVAQVIRKALARDRSERYQTATEFYEALALAAPGMLRSGGPTTSRSALSSFADSTPGSGAATPAVSADAEPRFGTAEGTAVRPSVADAGSQARRTIVTALIAALAAFAITVFVMARGTSGSASTDPAAAGAPTAGVSAEGAQAKSADPPAAQSSKIVVKPAAADAAADKPAAAPSALAAGAKPKPPATKSTPAVMKGFKPAGTGAKPANTGIAGGLELDTSGP